MKERIETFEVGPHPEVEVRIASGQIHVTEGPPGKVGVSISASNPDKLFVEQFRDHIQIGEEGRLRGSYRVRLEVPAGTDMSTAMGSGDVDIRGSVGSCTAKSASGDVRLQQAGGPVEIKVASGDVSIGQTMARSRVVSASGDIHIEEAHDDCSVTTASGNITLDRAVGGLQVKTASGDVNVGVFEGDTFSARSVSGDLRLLLPTGRRVDVDLKTLSGRVDLPPPRDNADRSQGSLHVSVAIKSVSGNIHIGLAPPPPPEAPREPASSE